MTTQLIPRPGVEIEQRIRQTPPAVVRPLLPAVCIAPAFEVVEPVTGAGELNPDAKFVDGEGYSYRNFFSKQIGATELSGGHVSAATNGQTNVKAGMVKLLKEEVRGFLSVASQPRELSEYNAGTKTHILKSFLASHHVATRPYILGSVNLAAGGFALAGSFLQLAVDVQGGTYPHYFPSSSEGKDVIVNFSTGSEVGGTLSAQDIVNQINAALGPVAYLYTDGASQFLAIVSQKWGVGGRIVIRDRGASGTLGFHTFGQGDLFVLGAGFRAKDDGDGDFMSATIEVYGGHSRVVGSTIFAGSILPTHSSDLTSPSNYAVGAWQVPGISFGSALSLRRGDEIVADGRSIGRVYQVSNQQIILGQAPLGEPDATMTKLEVGIQTHATQSFTPRYVYFNARNLTEADSANSTSASISSVNSGGSVWLDPAPAQVTGANNPVFPMAFGAGVLFRYAVTQDGEVKDERTHVLSGTAASLADLVTALNTGAATGVACSPPLAAYDEIYASSSSSNLRFQTGEVGVPRTGQDQSITFSDCDALILFDPGTPNPANIAAYETYTGLSHYSLNRRAGNGSALLHEGAMPSGVDASPSVTGTKHVRIESVEDNARKQVLDLAIQGDFAAGSTPFSATVLQSMYNMAAALNGDVQTSTSGKVLIDAVDDDTELAGDALSTHPSLVKWVFLGPDKYIVITGTETGTFTVGEVVEQATTLARGVVVARTAGASTTLQISVEEGSPAFNLTNNIVGEDSTATLTGAPMTAEPRLAVHCRQQGSSNYVRILEHGSGDPLADSIGFADGDTVRGEGIRLGSFFFFEVDQNPLPMQLTATARSIQHDSLGEKQYIFLEDMVEQAETLGVCTATLVDPAGANNSHMKLSSDKVGRPSQIKIDPQGEGTGNAGYVEWWCGPSAISVAEMGLSFADADAAADQTDGFGGLSKGLGRPYPDFSVWEANDQVSVWTGSQILRNVVTGVPLRDAHADLYISYRGLRTDITAASRQEGFSTPVRVASQSELQDVLGPINQKNPLALALSLALANSNGFPVYGLGLGAVSEKEPYGTASAWSDALLWLKSQRAYALAPVTTDRRSRELVDDHVLARSDGFSRGEAVVYHGIPLLRRYPERLVGSGLDGNAILPNMIALENSVVMELQALGISDPSNLSVSDGVFIELAGSSNVWSVASVVQSSGGCRVTVRTVFASGENDDGFYSTASLLDPSVSFINADWSIYRRGAAILTTYQMAEATGQYAPKVRSRRIRHKVVDALEVSIEGIAQRIGGEYIAAVYAGMASGLPAQQGFTNYPIKGVLRVWGVTGVLDEDEMDVLASTGKSLIIQAEEGGSIVSRMQLTTDTSSNETREDSVTRCLDTVSFLMRDDLRPQTGVEVITQAYLDIVSTRIQGRLERLVSSGVLVDGILERIAVDENDDTAIAITISCRIPKPANRFLLTIVV